MGKTKNLHIQLNNLYRLEEAARTEAKEAINRLREIHKQRIEIEILLSAGKN